MEQKLGIKGKVRLTLTHKDGTVEVQEFQNTLTKRFRDFIQAYLVQSRNSLWDGYAGFDAFNDGFPKELSMHDTLYPSHLSNGNIQQAVDGYNMYKGSGASNSETAPFAVDITGGVVTFSRTIDFLNDTFDLIAPIKIITLGQHTHVNWQYENTTMDFDKCFAYYVFPTPIDAVGSNIETMQIDWVWQFTSQGSLTNAALIDMWGLFTQNNDGLAGNLTNGATILYESDHSTEIANKLTQCRPGTVADVPTLNTNTQACAVYEMLTTETNDTATPIDVDVVEIGYQNGGVDVTRIYKDGFGQQIPQYATWNIKWVLVVTIND